jgi:hypothetical protein
MGEGPTEDNNLRYIYESDDVHCVNLLRMKREPFFQLCDLFVVENWSLTAYMHLLKKNKLQCSCMLLVTMRGLELLTSHLSRFFQRVLYAIGELRNELIVPPVTNVHHRILGSKRWYPYFKVGVPYILMRSSLINTYVSDNIHYHLCFVDLGLHRSN